MSQSGNMQYQQVVSSILRKIRGSTSQGHLSAKLGLKHNHVYKWESGIRKMQWSDFVKLCSLKKIDLQPLFFELYSFDGDVISFATICKQIMMDFPSQSLSKQLGVSKFRIDSWRSGKGPFYFHDLICILDKFSHNLAEFSLYFLGLEEVNRLNIDLNDYEMRKFEAEYPIISLVLRILETDDHMSFAQASSRFVAQMTGLADTEVKSLLDKASALGFVSKKGDKYFSENLHIDIRGIKAAKQRRFWIEKALHFLDEGKLVAPDSIFGNIVYCISKEGQNKILDEYLKFYNSARGIIEKDRGGHLPMILNIQMLRMDKR